MKALIVLAILVPPILAWAWLRARPPGVNRETFAHTVAAMIVALSVCCLVAGSVLVWTEHRDWLIWWVTGNFCTWMMWATTSLNRLRLHTGMAQMVMHPGVGVAFRSEDRPQYQVVLLAMKIARYYPRTEVMLVRMKPSGLGLFINNMLAATFDVEVAVVSATFELLRSWRPDGPDRTWPEAVGAVRLVQTSSLPWAANMQVTPYAD